MAEAVQATRIESHTTISPTTLEAWLEEGERLFGKDRTLWEFVCPSCGNIQRPIDFAKFKDQGASAETAYFNCIGRYDGHGHVPMCSGQKPCNYTSGGLFNISPVRVLLPDGEMCSAFAFNYDEDAGLEHANRHANP